MRIAALALAALALAALAAPAGALQEPGESRVVRAVTIYVPAVSGEGEGDILEVTVTLAYPGRGLVNVESGGPVGSTTVYSMRMAVIAAALSAGVDWRSIDVNVTFNTYSAIEGPSASFAVAAVVSGLLEPFDVPDVIGDYAITGAVSPDGLNSRVGGVQEKCVAANERGMVLAYPPSNEREAGVCEKAVPLPGLTSALEVLFNVTLGPFAFPAFYPESYAAVMAEAAEEMAAMAEDLARGLPPDVASSVQALVDEARRLVGERPYSAASLAFTAYSRALMANASIHADTPAEAERVIGEAQRELDATAGELPSQAATWPALELLSVAYTRLANAEASLYRARALADQGFYSNASAEAAFTIARMASIKAWIQAAEALNTTGPPISEEQARALASLAAEYAGVAVNYSVSLLEAIKRETGDGGIDRAIELIRNLYEKGLSLMDSGNYIGALGYFREALSEASYSIFYHGLAVGAGPGSLDLYLSELQALLNRTASIAASRGVYSVLASSYLEYSRTLLERGDPFGAVRLLEAALASTMISALLVLQAPSYLLHLAGADGKPPAGPPPEAGVEVTGLIGRIAGIVAAGVAVAFAAGYMAGATARYKRLEEAILRL